MEFLLSFPTAALVGGIFVSLVFSYYLLWKPKSGQKRTAPEAAGAWPVMGHLHLFRGSQIPYKTLAAMADKYGPIFAIKIGVHRTIVVSNWEIAEECFTTNDRVLANRPKSIAVEHLGYNYAMFGLSLYGPYWLELRKIAMVEILSNHWVELLGHIRQSEIKTSIKEIYKQWIENNQKSGTDKVFVEMKKWFGDVTFNVILKMVLGKRYSGEEEGGVRFKKAIREWFEYLGMFLVSDALPFLRWLDLGGHERAMKRIAKEMDNLLESSLEEHKQKRISGVVKGDQDFMDVMLSILPEDLYGYDSDTINKATCLVLLSGAADTTMVTLTWALTLLLNNRHVLKKAQEELDIHVGRERQVEESDLKNLVYLRAILKETLRLYPAAPLLPRESTEDCTLGGYHVPKGTRVLVNLPKIHRDPRVWLDPCEFRPERFLTMHRDIDVEGQNFELIPFGSGRRMCPGMDLALQVMQLTLASLLHGFEFATITNEPVDMSENPGQTNLKITPLDVLLTPRLSSKYLQIK
ncbi:hypothetical protein L1049_003864 [Liquidambar formosana]|uniref:Cytochrome P450 n=1 Tax=Liquidambar formosana TaxID=63359 RepID=A0AAP0X068_LIQFO